MDNLCATCSNDKSDCPARWNKRVVMCYSYVKEIMPLIIDDVFYGNYRDVAIRNREVQRDADRLVLERWKQIEADWLVALESQNEWGLTEKAFKIIIDQHVKELREGK